MNENRVDEMVTFIENNPDKHAQSVWTNIQYDRTKEKEYAGQEINCGTAACLAGQAAFHYAPVGTIFLTEELKLPFDPETGLRATKSYSRYGREILDLSHDEENYLFDSWRTVEEMRAYVNASPDVRDSIIVHWHVNSQDN